MSQKANFSPKRQKSCTALCPPLTCSQLRDEAHALLGRQRSAFGHVGFLLAPGVPRFQDLLPLLTDFCQPALEIASPALLQTFLFQNFLVTGRTRGGLLALLWTSKHKKVQMNAYLKQTQDANFQGNSLCQATKWHLNNRQTVKNDEKWERKNLSCFGWVFFFSPLVQCLEDCWHDLRLFSVFFCVVFFATNFNHIWYICTHMTTGIFSIRLYKHTHPHKGKREGQRKRHVKWK